MSGYWRVEFRYNGRKEGGSRVVVTTCPESEKPMDYVAALEKEAVRKNGSIFINGHLVEWVEEESGRDGRAYLSMVHLMDAIEAAPSMVGPRFGEMTVEGGVGRVRSNVGMAGAFVYEYSVRCVGRNNAEGDLK